METSLEIALFKQLQATENVYSLKFKPNIYSIFGKIDGQEVCLTIEHDGYAPRLNSDRDYSHFGEYICNLTDQLIDDYKIANKIDKRFDEIAYLYTDSNGKALQYSKTVS